MLFQMPYENLPTLIKYSNKRHTYSNTSHTLMLCANEIIAACSQSLFF